MGRIFPPLSHRIFPTFWQTPITEIQYITDSVRKDLQKAPIIETQSMIDTVTKHLQKAPITETQTITDSVETFNFISLKEVDLYGFGVQLPYWTWEKSSASVLRMYTADYRCEGRAMIFFIFVRSWLNGKTVKVYWKFSSQGDVDCNLRIRDGVYERSSSTDFPQGGPINKGAGILQTPYNSQATFDWTETSFTASLGSGNQYFCMFSLENSVGYEYKFPDLSVDYVHIYDGANLVYSEDFTKAVVMEVTGGRYDYGYVNRG